MFKVITPGFSQTFDRWTDALDAAKALIPQCKSWTQDIRIFLCDELVWIYSKEYKYPQYIGAGNYNRLARLFIQETLEAEDNSDSDNSEKTIN